MRVKQTGTMKIHLLNRDSGTRPRVALNETVVREYATAMNLGDVFPPVEAVTDGEEFWLIDGYHRIAALELNGKDSVLVTHTRGSLEDAIWGSCTVNRCHGLQRTNADKRLVVEMALLHRRSARLSDRQIARYCGVHHDTVGRVRRSLVEAGKLQHFNSRVVSRGGNEFLQNVDGVSRSNRDRARASTAGPADHGQPTGEARTDSATLRELEIAGPQAERSAPLALPHTTQDPELEAPRPASAYLQQQPTPQTEPFPLVAQAEPTSELQVQSDSRPLILDAQRSYPRNPRWAARDSTELAPLRYAAQALLESTLEASLTSLELRQRLCQTEIPRLLEDLTATCKSLLQELATLEDRTCEPRSTTRDNPPTPAISIS